MALELEVTGTQLDMELVFSMARPVQLLKQSRPAGLTEWASVEVPDLDRGVDARVIIGIVDRDLHVSTPVSMSLFPAIAAVFRSPPLRRITRSEAFGTSMVALKLFFGVSSTVSLALVLSIVSAALLGLL